MNLLKSISVFLVLFSISCAGQSSDIDFSKDGVSFKYPSDWSITDQEDLDGAGYYLSVEKEGFNSSGLLTITWVNVILNSSEYLKIIQDELETQIALSDLKFELAQDVTYNGMQSISCNFTFNTLGVKHRGIIYVFLNGQKTYSIIKQEALEDISKNKEGFDLIESTFKVK